jgi:hypothetical protein
MISIVSTFFFLAFFLYIENKMNYKEAAGNAIFDLPNIRMAKMKYSHL